MTLNRRDLFGAALAATAAAAVPGTAAAQTEACKPRYDGGWRTGFEGQRVADLGDGRFLNPLLAGDRPDPAILKDGEDYYMTFSSFDSYPGLTVWHSRDLVNWTPPTAALTRNIGSNWAVSLEKHEERYFLYIPVKASPNSIYVIHAPTIDGPWSDPIDLKMPSHIDPCHVVGQDGSRWLFLSGGDRIRLSADGLSTVGKVEHVYDPWRYPDDWDVEGFSPEGPKIHRHNGWFYMLTAVGGTAGPPTGDMVIAARSRSIHGPREQHPGNPLVRTVDNDERWWSRGHASLVEAPDGSWWSVYHGFDNGFWTLGRQALLDPVEWTRDGWFRMTGGDLSKPLRKPKGGRAGPHGLPLSDDFRTLRLGSKWNIFRPAPNESARARVEGGALVLAARGKAPSDSPPLMLGVREPGAGRQEFGELPGGRILGHSAGGGAGAGVRSHLGADPVGAQRPAGQAGPLHRTRDRVFGQSEALRGRGTCRGRGAGAGDAAAPADLQGRQARARSRSLGRSGSPGGEGKGCAADRPQRQKRSGGAGDGRGGGGYVRAAAQGERGEGPGGSERSAVRDPQAVVRSDASGRQGRALLRGNDGAGAVLRGAGDGAAALSLTALPLVISGEQRRAARVEPAVAAAALRADLRHIVVHAKIAVA